MSEVEDMPADTDISARTRTLEKFWEEALCGGGGEQVRPKPESGMQVCQKSGERQHWVGTACQWIWRSSILVCLCISLQLPWYQKVFCSVFTTINVNLFMNFNFEMVQKANKGKCLPIPIPSSCFMPPYNQHNLVFVYFSRDTYAYTQKKTIFFSFKRK